ncbi:MAG: PH domain-containing protein [Deltaproteobacteria bacterium]|nr:PH domain-containing protein [Deltaproteobacteria bacterium]MDQ3295634.1 PH domain-containing protein [Myxococcota bacterium]
MLADGARHQLDPRFIRVERIVGYLTTATLSIAGFVALALVAVFAPIQVVWLAVFAAAWLVMTIAFAWLAHRWPELEFRHAAYSVDIQVLEIRGGVLWRHVRKVPRSRVQHTDVAQSPLERRYGLATLVIHTAGTEHARVTLGGLAHQTALDIREHLLPREHLDAG